MEPQPVQLNADLALGAGSGAVRGVLLRELALIPHKNTENRFRPWNVRQFSTFEASRDQAARRATAKHKSRRRMELSTATDRVAGSALHGSPRRRSRARICVHKRCHEHAQQRSAWTATPNGQAGRTSRRISASNAAQAQQTQQQTRKMATCPGEARSGLTAEQAVGEPQSARILARSAQQARRRPNARLQSRTRTQRERITAEQRMMQIEQTPATQVSTQIRANHTRLPGSDRAGSAALESSVSRSGTRPDTQHVSQSMSGALCQASGTQTPGLVWESRNTFWHSEQDERPGAGPYVPTRHAVLRHNSEGQIVSARRKGHEQLQCERSSTEQRRTRCTRTSAGSLDSDLPIGRAKGQASVAHAERASRAVCGSKQQK